MRRVILGILGAVIIVIGAASAFAGAVLVGAFGADGRVDSPTFRLTTNSVAFSSDVARLDADLPSGVQLAQIHLSASSLSGKNVFVGVGPARQVLAYLAGSPYDVVSGVDGRTSIVDLRRVPGAGTPAAPTSETFWVARAFGSGQQTIDWSIAGGRYLFVIMNVDGSAGVDVQARAGVSAPWVFGAGIVALTVGVVLVILGAILLALGLRSPRASVPPPVYAQAPAGPASHGASIVLPPDPVAVDAPITGPPAERPPDDGESIPQAPPREAGA